MRCLPSSHQQALKVAPSYLQDWQRKLGFLSKNRHEQAQRNHEHRVNILVKSGAITVGVEELGSIVAVSQIDALCQYNVCVGDLSCSCQDRSDDGGKARICKHVEAAARLVSLTKQMRQASAQLLLQKRMLQSAKLLILVSSAAICSVLSSLPAQKCRAQRQQTDCAASLPADQPILVKHSFPKQQRSVCSLPVCTGCGMASLPTQREAKVAATAAAGQCQSEPQTVIQRLARGWASLGRKVPKPLLDKVLPTLLNWDAKLEKREGRQPAMLLVCAFSSTGFTIADPEDMGMLDVAGLDASLPKITRAFFLGRSDGEIVSM